MLLAGQRIKTLPSRLDARDLARLAAAGSVIELERTVSAAGNVTIGGHVVNAGSPLAGQRVTLRLDGSVDQALGICLAGSTKGIVTTVAARSPSGVCTVRRVPSLECSIGSHAKPMFFCSRGE